MKEVSLYETRVGNQVCGWRRPPSRFCRNSDGHGSEVGGRGLACHVAHVHDRSLALVRLRAARSLWPIMATNMVTFLFMAAILTLKLRFRRGSWAIHTQRAAVRPRVSTSTTVSVPTAELDKVCRSLLECLYNLQILSDGKRVQLPRGPAAVKGTNPADATVLKIVIGESVKGDELEVGFHSPQIARHSSLFDGMGRCGK